ncbi:MAG: transporter substrate-binding domain-containing protein [Lachnospiraceae bacterium]|nr:transporter substrate-binding domain-containing protein [Lachnospiraceae bacterium]
MKKSVKKVVSILLASSMIFMLFACNNAANKNVTNSVKDKKTFTVGFDAEYPPFGYEKDGDYTGFDLEVAEKVCEMEGWELIKQPIDWDAKDLELNAGNIDCIWNGFTITGREDAYTWTRPYCDNSIVFIVRKDSDIKETKDLKGKYVVTQAGSSGYAAIMEEENDALRESFGVLETTPDYNTAFMNLESGLCECVVVDIGVAKYQLNTKSDKFFMLEEPFTSEKYAIGFKKGNTELRDIVEKDVMELYKNGTFMDIAKKYSDYSVPDMVCLE